MQAREGQSQVSPPTRDRLLPLACQLGGLDMRKMDTATRETNRKRYEAIRDAMADFRASYFFARPMYRNARAFPRVMRQLYRNFVRVECRPFRSKKSWLERDWGRELTESDIEYNRKWSEVEKRFEGVEERVANFLRSRGFIAGFADGDVWAAFAGEEENLYPASDVR